MALQYDIFRELFGTAEYTVPATEESEPRDLLSRNYFITKATGVVKFYDPKVTGGRTGEISTSDRSLACTAQSGDLQLMSIVMGAEGILEADGYSLYKTGNFEETETLLNYGFHNFSVSQILLDSQSVAQFPVINGENHVVGKPVNTVYSALPNDTKREYLVWKYIQSDSQLAAPLYVGDSVGTVQVWYGTTCLAQSDLVAMNSSAVSERSQNVESVQPEKETGVNTQNLLTVLGIIFACILAAVLLFVVSRVIRGAMIRARRRRRRRNRRRSH